MKHLILGVLAICLAGSIKAQSSSTFTGKISYISSQNVYVKFESTKNIQPGDTLYLQNKDGLLPILVVTNLSSTSCVCKPVAEIDFDVSLTVTAKSKAQAVTNEPKQTIAEEVENSNDTAAIAVETKRTATLNKQKISGAIAASSYSYFSNSTDNRPTRFQYLFSLNAKNIADSKFSAESYVSFRHDKDRWDLIQDNIYQALKVYNLSIKYDDNTHTQLILGRKINPRVSSIGAVDGIQYERRWRTFFIGAVVGTRPSYDDYSFDINLPQMGAYLSHLYSNTIGEMQNSVAVFEQRNAMKTDRRFAYFQHSSSLVKSMYFFSTVEFDLYKNINNKPENTFSLSSIYLLLNYKPIKRLTLSTTYDNRKNVIYYETYKSYINQIIEIEARQGLGFRTHYNTTKNISLGFRAGYHFANKNSAESKNLYGYVSYYNIPTIKLNATLAVNYLETAYIDGKILNMNIARDFLKDKMYADCGYQWVNYSFAGSETTMVQHIVNLSLNWRFYKNHSISANYEKTFENADRNSRLSFQIRKRF